MKTTDFLFSEKMAKKAILVLVFFVLVSAFLPFFANAAEDPSPLVRCGKGEEAGVSKECDFQELIKLINRVIQYLIYAGVPIAAIVIGVGGFKILTAGGNPSKAKEGKKMMTKAGIGLLIMISAWLAVEFLLKSLLNNEFLNYSFFR